MSRTSLFLLAGFLIGLAASACGTMTGPSCSPATCGGCCSASGKCEAGSSPTACGINGGSCGRCGSGTVCQLGECTVANNTGGGTGGGATGGGTGGGTTGGGTGGGTTGGGTGGGTTGGGTGGGTTGGGSGCRMVTTVTTLQANLLNAEYRTFSSNTGFYNMALWGLVPPLVSGFDGFRVEVVYPNGTNPPTPPLTATLTAQGYRTCPVCALFYETCDMMGDCQKEYLAQSGTVNISRADRNAAAGRIVGSASNLRFVEWNLMTDTAVPGGGCIIATTVGPWDVGWNADGGMPPP